MLRLPLIPCLLSFKFSLVLLKSSAEINFDALIDICHTSVSELSDFNIKSGNDPWLCLKKKELVVLLQIPWFQFPMNIDTLNGPIVRYYRVPIYREGGGG